MPFCVCCKQLKPSLVLEQVSLFFRQEQHPMFAYRLPMYGRYSLSEKLFNNPLSRPTIRNHAFCHQSFSSILRTLLKLLPGSLFASVVFIFLPCFSFLLQLQQLVMTERSEAYFSLLHVDSLSVVCTQDSQVIREDFISSLHRYSEIQADIQSNFRSDLRTVSYVLNFVQRMFTSSPFTLSIIVSQKLPSP